ncbi:hypothetical protein [Actinophytocola glycyrrhizae]|uniref:Uncharacterized protein n=1 Tax=Actinophytocola glycyrrhizae TaxID=2044873 RepID=A0ABV9RTB4_9PSEU
MSTQTTIDGVIAEAARAAVSAMRPNELPILEDILDPPHRRLFGNSDSVGFGVGELTEWVSPVCVAVVTWYARIWYTEGKSQIEKRTRKWISRRISRGGDEEPTPPARPELPMTSTQLEAHADEVARFAVTLGLDKRSAQLLGKAVVGAVVEKLTAETKA